MNAYRLIGADANAIAPGKRPLSSSTPTFIEADRGVMVLGTPGRQLHHRHGAAGDAQLHGWDERERHRQRAALSSPVLPGRHSVRAGRIHRCAGAKRYRTAVTSFSWPVGSGAIFRWCCGTTLAGTSKPLRECSRGVGGGRSFTESLAASRSTFFFRRFAARRSRFAMRGSFVGSVGTGSVPARCISHARQRYHAAAERCGDQRSPKSASAFGCGIFRRP